MLVRKSNRFEIYNTLFWMINVMFSTSFLIWVSYNWNRPEILYDFNTRLFPWVCILICTQMISFKLKKVSFYDFGLWFITISYFFMFGYLFRDVFGLESRLLWNPIVNFKDIELFHTYIFVIISLELFLFGYLMVYKEVNVIKKDDLNKVSPDKRMYIVGVILLLIGGISKLINDLQIIYVTQLANSYSALSNAVKSGIVDDLAYLMLPGIFFLFFSGRIKERTKKIIFVLVLLYLVCMMMLTGSRKVQVFSILTVFLGYQFSLNKKHLSIKKIILYVFMAIIFLNILIIIRDNRFDLVSIGPELMGKIISFNFLENIVGEILAETGLTLLSVASIIKIVPKIMPFQYGTTYLRTLPSFLPIGWLLGNFFNLASSSYVINTYTKLPLGSSFIGDLYWNWGYFGGAFAALLSGVFISKFIHTNSKSNIRKNCAIYFSIFSNLIILVRSVVFDIYRPIVMILIIIIIINQVIIPSRRVKND